MIHQTSKKNRDEYNPEIANNRPPPTNHIKDFITPSYHIT